MRMKRIVSGVLGLLLLPLLQSCAPEGEGDKVAVNSSPLDPGRKRQPTEEFNAYWFAGEAEITSYQLSQARYGEMREGKAVLIYVTEPFLPGIQVKADEASDKNVPVLKLNHSKKFLTGIYPYSIMSSVFYPIYREEHAMKVSTSVQEWCGHIYTQLNNRARFEIDAHSYFESEADQQLELEKSVLEDEIWTLMRINPDELPSGRLQMIPSFEYLRLSHKEIRAYEAQANLSNTEDHTVYKISYPELERELEIRFETEFPHQILEWKESYKSGFGPSAKVMSSSAKKMKTLKTPYWQKNGNKDVILRDSLGL